MGFVDGPRRVFINRIATSGRHIGSQGCHIAPHRHVPPGKLQGCHPSGATSRTRLTSRVTCPAAAVMLRLKQGCRLPPSCTGRGPAAKLNDSVLLLPSSKISVWLLKLRLYRPAWGRRSER